MMDINSKRSTNSNVASTQTQHEGVPNLDRRIDYKIWGALLAIILFVVIVRVRIIDVPLERDEGSYAVNGSFILDGYAPYEKTYDIKPPGLHTAFALIMLVFGKTTAGLHTGLLIINVLLIFVMFFLTRRLYDPATGVMAAAFYAILSLSIKVLGFTLNSEPIMLLPALIGIIVMLNAIEKKRQKDFFLSGFLLGTAFIVKQTTVFFILFSGIYILFSFIKNKPVDSKRGAKDILTFSAGVFIPYIFVCIGLYFAGTFDEFWLWTFTWPSKYVSALSFSKGLEYFTYSTNKILSSQLLIWLLAGFGLVAMFWDKINRAKFFFVVSLFIFSFFAVSTGYYFRSHYFRLLFPVMSILAALGANSASRFIKGDDKELIKRGVTLLVVAVPILFMVVKESGYLFTNTPVEISRAAYGLNPFAESPVIAKYIKERTNPEDKIAVFGSEPQIYFYSQRRPASRHIMPYTIVGKNDLSKKLQNEMFTEVESARPKYIVYLNVYTSWLANKKTEPTLYAWMEYYLKFNYKMVGMIDIISPEVSKYYWDDEVTGNESSQYEVYVFERIQ